MCVKVRASIVEVHGVHTAICCRKSVEVEWRSPVKVDGVDQLGKGLHRAAVAAPEAVQGGTPTVAAVPLTLPGPQGQQVQQHSCNNEADVIHSCCISYTAVHGASTHECSPTWPPPPSYPARPPGATSAAALLHQRSGCHALLSYMSHGCARGPTNECCPPCLAPFPLSTPHAPLWPYRQSCSTRNSHLTLYSCTGGYPTHFLYKLYYTILIVYIRYILLLLLLLLL